MFLWTMHMFQRQTELTSILGHILLTYEVKAMAYVVESHVRRDNVCKA